MGSAVAADTSLSGINVTGVKVIAKPTTTDTRNGSAAVALKFLTMVVFGWRGTYLLILHAANLSGHPCRETSATLRRAVGSQLLPIPIVPAEEAKCIPQ